MKSTFLVLALGAILSSNVSAGRLHGVANLDVLLTNQTFSVSGRESQPQGASIPFLTVYNNNRFPVNVVATINAFGLMEDGEANLGGGISVVFPQETQTATSISPLRRVLTVPENGQFIFKFSDFFAFFGTPGVCSQKLQAVNYNAYTSLTAPAIITRNSTSINNVGVERILPVVLNSQCNKTQYSINLQWSDETSVVNENSGQFGTTRLTYPILATVTNDIEVGLDVFTSTSSTFSVKARTEPQYLIKAQE